MIRLTRLNGHPIVLNSDLVKFVERAPDTVITLMNGEKVIVRESEDEVVHLIREFRRSVMTATPPGVDGSQASSEIFPRNANARPEVQRHG